jgi:hypothetical protein
VISGGKVVGPSVTGAALNQLVKITIGKLVLNDLTKRCWAISRRLSW